MFQKIYKKQWEITIPQPLEEVWAFFSRPENLNDITPEDMDFEILSDIEGVPMYEGMIILYKVSPVLNIKMRWVTEITHIRDGKYFIDEQRFGPYALWHHQHHFQEVSNGTATKMTDILHYGIPFGPVGRLANAVFVSRKVDSIFEYRERVIRKLFNF